MGLLKKKKKFTFSLSIDSLTLGAGEGRLLVSWERGKRGGGATAAASPEPSGGAAAYHFSHPPIAIPATLYKVRPAAPGPVARPLPP